MRRGEKIEPKSHSRASAPIWGLTKYVYKNWSSQILSFLYVRWVKVINIKAWRRETHGARIKSEKYFNKFS